jgi:hypothetical protein
MTEMTRILLEHVIPAEASKADMRSSDYNAKAGNGWRERR